MSKIPTFSANPIEWPHEPSEISQKVAEVLENLRACTAVHPVAAMMGATEPVGFEPAVPLAVSGVDFSGALAWPIKDIDGKPVNVLLASSAGDGTIEEAIIPGAPISRGFVRIGHIKSRKIHVTIDLASALVIAHATGEAVACAVYIDNLSPVVEAIHERYPDMEIIVCAGPSHGMSHPVAASAAASIGAKLATADTGGTFFGCYNETGIEGILRSLEAAEIPDRFDLPVRNRDPLDPRDPFRWPGHVNGNLMAQHAVMLIRRYLVVDVYIAITIVLWALTTYFVKDIRIAPLLAFLSPTKRCGKTTALGLLKSLVCRPYAASNMTPATLYRMPLLTTLLIDEIDTFLRSKELVGIVNSGHTRDAASIARVVKGKTESFETFFMKAFFGIGLLPETLADRSIVILLERKADGEEVEKHIVSENDVFAPVRACFAQLAHQYADAVRHASRNPIKLGNDRAGDNWEPLLAVASLLGENWVVHARRAARLLSARAGHHDDAGLEALLRDIMLAFVSNGATKLPTGHLIGFLTDDDEKPWATFSNGRPITTHALARMLKPLGIKSRNLRAHPAPGQDGYSPPLKGYFRSDFEKAFRQYVPNQPENNDADADSPV